MSSNVVNQVPYIPTTKQFPAEIKELSVELSRDRVDIANSINNRTISLFPTVRSALNGESWFLVANQRQQGFRQVYTFTTLTAINHQINNVVPGQFVRCFGSYTDGTKTYGLIYGNIGTPIAGQIVFDVTATQIEFAAEAGSPALQSGVVVLEWLSQA